MEVTGQFPLNPLEKAPGTHLEAVWAPQPFVHTTASHYIARA
jgi:hypothetical protein